MELMKTLEFFLRYLAPFIVMWNIYLHRKISENEKEIYNFRLEVAKHYTGKEDLKEMLEALEERLEKRLDQLVKTLCAAR